MKRRDKKSSPLLRVLLWGLLALFILVAGAGLYGYFWVQRYLNSPAFREMVARQAGQAANAEVTLADLHWSGPTMHISRAELAPAGAQRWKLIEGEGLQATLNFQAARRGVWQVTRITLDRLRMAMRAAHEVPAAPSPAASSDEDAAPSRVPAWLKGWLPTRTQIDEVEVAQFDLLPAEAGGVKVTDLRVKANPATDEGAWLLRGSGGTLVMPGVSQPCELQTLSARLDRRSLALNDGVARWMGDSEITARGDIPFEGSRGWTFAGKLSGLDLSHVLTPDWRTKVSGVLGADYVAVPGKLTGKLQVRSGVVQSLPVLDRIADFTRTERFRRVVLDQATADFEKAGDTTYIRNLVLQSNGLVRVQGDVVIQGRAVSSRLMVGVLPDSLRWIPGSQSRVFTEENPAGPAGFVWTYVNLSGTVDSIREDLTDRLLVAMGKAALEVPLDLAGKSMDVLGTVAPPGTVKDAIKTGKDILGSGLPGQAVESGLDLLKSLPIIGN